MDAEYIKYRQASFKGKLKIAKRFNKFYMNQYIPMTKLEQKDLDKSRNLYRGYTMGFSLFFGYMSFRYRRSTIAHRDVQGTTKYSYVLISILNDCVSAFSGYLFGHFLANDYTYKHRMYVLERLYYEESIQYRGRVMF